MACFLLNIVVTFGVGRNSEKGGNEWEESAWREGKQKLFPSWIFCFLCDFRSNVFIQCVKMKKIVSSEAALKKK